MSEFEAWARHSASLAGKEPKPEDLVQTEIPCTSEYCGRGFMQYNPERIGGWTHRCDRCFCMTGCSDDVLP